MKDATYYAQKIKRKKISAQELMIETVTRAHEINTLNAFVEVNQELAMKQLEIPISSVSSAPFSGVPIALKDLGQAKKGFRQTFGSRLFKNYRAKETNNFVRQIEYAGFIPFGVTTSPEFGFKNITDALLYGPAKNAWNDNFYSGGSSGGAASAVASGVIPLAGASDGGGSIRIPASFSGLIGFKPSRGNIVTGPSSWRDWQGASINFVLGVSVRDLKTLFPLLAPNNQCSPFLRPIPRLPHSNKLRIAVCIDSPIGNLVSQAANQATIEAASFLEQAGHSVEFIRYPIDGSRLIRSYYEMNGGETSAMMKNISNDLKRQLTINDMELSTWTIYQYGKRLTAADYVSSFSAWDEATVKMEDLFESFDIFLSPTATATAPSIHTDFQSDALRLKMTHAEDLSKMELADLVYDMFEKGLYLTPYTQLANLTGQPAISLPTFIAANGLPLGIQLMAAKGNDALLLAVAEQFEAADHFKLPAVYKKINV
ncbi:amidase family protein [Vagococcus vulneris]|uniref:Amidase n=1 Tax=Vagococcus vulneris TaxID=1977869 RepID=A0A429ZWY7_9ENTE|nr:amidase family protein [Vagococcus vulneris]RST98326.1 amidase [Vagococcus vulneris]